MSVYLDNAATSFPKPESVYRAVEDAMRRIGVGPGRGGYGKAIEATRLVFEAREAVSSFFGLADSSRVVFTHSATEALNIAVQGVLKEGDHVVTTTMEHNSLARPLHSASRRGVEVTWVEADREGRVSPERMAEAMRPNTRLVAMTHCSNVTGTIQPVADVGAIAHDAGALFLVDAAQSAGHLPIDVNLMKIDLLAAPGHKGLLGPQGTGLLLLGGKVEPEPLLFGGTGGSSSSMEQPVAVPERLESGTLNTPGIAGLKAGIDFIRDTGMASIAARESELTELLVAELLSIPGVTIHGLREKTMRAGVVSFTASGIDPAQLGFLLGEQEICVRVGLHCAPCAHRTIGTFPEGTVRVSPGYFNTEEDIALLSRGVRSIVSGAGRGR
ncbi:aminotransferase class V-fold PLP-dependent enzyme [Geobacter sp. DSM 9736]|uniref:aminotransferase class V-fold PLP-dependent enzyme n=1 Tax=Geobacter sp. DSM 9736 TaxID=1277350 RepID=UPI000B50ED47|nr:aminotransferase class V-fold PLP-dependent enzyme [Geobacter sp. DSM 9736]SNB45891.1 cysteine desulfurase family protein [Geobacter sp. DSM 9736]